MKIKLPASLIYAVLGGLLSLGSLIGLIYLLVTGSLSVLQIIALVLACIGGLYLLVTALLTQRKHKAPLPQTKKTEKNNLTPLKKPDGVSSPLSVLILTLAALVFFWGCTAAQQVESVPQSTVHSSIVYEKATVLTIPDEMYQGQQDIEDVPVGKQTVVAELTSGPHAGDHITLTNNLSFLYGTVLEVGDDITVSVIYNEDGSISETVLQDYDRTVPLLIVLALFLLVTVLVGGKVGAKSLLGLTLTIVCVFAILIPLLIGGAPTIPLILAMCAFVTVVEFTILGGINKKTVCAILGTISGVVFAALFSKLACALLRVDGFKMYDTEPSIEALLQIKQGQSGMDRLMLKDLLAGGILIATLGAVNDVAMSISSAMNELISVNPNLTRKELLKSGMTIGRDMVGTMTNTLILAFVGSGLVMMIYLVSLEPSFQQLMSTSYLAVEVVQGVASSIGVILAVPLSVLIGTFLYGHKKHAK